MKVLVAGASEAAGNPIVKELIVRLSECIDCVPAKSFVAIAQSEQRWLRLNPCLAVARSSNARLAA